MPNSAAEKRGLRPKKRAADREVCRNRKNGRSIVKKRLTMQEKDYIIAKVKAEAPLLTRRLSARRGLRNNTKACKGLKQVVFP